MRPRGQPVHRRAPRARRRGIASMVALVTLAVLGMLVTGLAIAVMRDVRAARDALLRIRAAALAEEGLSAAVRAPLPPGDSLAPRGLQRTLVLDNGDARDTVRVWKLGASTYALVSEAVVRDGPRRVRRRLALLATAIARPVDTAAAPAAADSGAADAARMLRPLAARGWAELP